jgi:hypothetical protein
MRCDRHCELGTGLLGRPYWMKRYGGGYYSLSVGKEVDISLVRKSPVASWTRGALMTLTGAKGSDALEHAS